MVPEELRLFVSSKCMGKPATLLEGLCGQAVSLGARSIQGEYKDGREWVFADRAGMGIGIANYKSSGPDGKRVAAGISTPLPKSPFAALLADGSTFSRSPFSRVLARMRSQ